MLAVRGRNINTVTGGMIKDGTILIDKGRIIDIGTRIDIPDKCRIIDAGHNIIMPGLIDAHTHIGVSQEGLSLYLSDHNEMSDPITPHIRVIDAIEPVDPIFREVMESGVTTVMIAPGSANPIGGQCSVVKTSGGNTVEEILLLQDAGMKFALGENPKRVYSAKNKPPATRMGISALIRENLIKTKDYISRQKDKRDKNDGKGDFDIRLEALKNIVKGRSRARIHAHKACDIMTAMRIADEFKLDITLEHCTEGDLVADEIAKRKIPAVLSPLMSPRSKPETAKRDMALPAKLVAKGIEVAIATDGLSKAACWLPINAGLCVRYGLSEESAIKAITINPARILGIEKRVGSLEKGKDADLVIFNGHPLETRTRVACVIIDGIIKFHDQNIIEM